MSLDERDLPSMGLSALRAPQSPLIASVDTFALPPPSPPSRGVPAPIHSTPSVQPLPTSPISMDQHQGMQGTPGPQHLPLPPGPIHSSLAPLQHQGQQQQQGGQDDRGAFAQLFSQRNAGAAAAALFPGSASTFRGKVQIELSTVHSGTMTYELAKLRCRQDERLARRRAARSQRQGR